MLGSLRTKKTWRWAAVGKHPAAADYIQLEDGSPLLQAVAEWMTKGFEHFQRGTNALTGNHSWRFWLRGVKRDNLIAGMIRDSSDRIGRPYPLMIMGEGHLKGWERDWVWLPAALNKLWQRAEYIGSHPYDSLGALSEEVNGLNAPEAHSMSSGESMPTAAMGNGDGAFSAGAESLRREGKALIPLGASDGGDPVQVSVGWHLRLKACTGDLPRGVFMGGSPQQTCLAVMQQPLGPRDFELLWSV